MAKQKHSTEFGLFYLGPFCSYISFNIKNLDESCCIALHIF